MHAFVNHYGGCVRAKTFQYTAGQMFRTAHFPMTNWQDTHTGSSIRTDLKLTCPFNSCTAITIIAHEELMLFLGTIGSAKRISRRYHGHHVLHHW